MDTSLTNPSSLEWQDEPLEMAVDNQQLLTGRGVAWAACRVATTGLMPRTPETSLTLKYGGQVLRFPTPHEFEFALTARVGLPVRRVVELDCLSDTQLRDSVADTRRLEAEFAQMLSQAQATGESLRDLLAAIEAKSFSKDHEWRALFTALANLDDAVHDPYRRVALRKYGQYLVSRRNALQEARIALQAQTRKSGSRGGAGLAAARFERLQHVRRARRDARSGAPGGHWTLPGGTPIGIDLLDPAPFCVLLAAYTFRIEREHGQMFVVDTNSGTRNPLHGGRNSIGRAHHCDIVVDSAYREISRFHVVINVFDSRTLVITDHSAQGTSIPSARVMGLSAS